MTDTVGEIGIREMPKLTPKSAVGFPLSSWREGKANRNDWLGWVNKKNKIRLFFITILNIKEPKQTGEKIQVYKSTNYVEII